MRKSIKQLVLVSALAGCTSLTVLAQTDSTTSSGQSGSSSSQAAPASEKPDRQTTEFIKDAARDNAMEMALADVAIQKAQNPELKAFAQKMQQDHQQSMQQLQPLAQKYGISLEDAAKAKTSHEVTKLDKEASGPEWDQRYAKDALKNHAKDIEKYNEAAKNTQAPDVQQFAQGQLPILRQHFDQAKTVAQTVGIDQSTISSYEKKLPPAVGGTGEQQNKLQGTGSSTDQGLGTTNNPSEQGTGARDLKSGTSNP